MPGQAKSCELLGRLIAVMGRRQRTSRRWRRPAQASPYAEQGLTALHRRISHAVAGMLKRSYHAHPTFETFLSACGRVSVNSSTRFWRVWRRPKSAPKARFMNVHRLFTWADRVAAALAMRRCQGRST